MEWIESDYLEHKSERQLLLLSFSTYKQFRENKSNIKYESVKVHYGTYI